MTALHPRLAAMPLPQQRAGLRYLQATLREHGRHMTPQCRAKVRGAARTLEMRLRPAVVEQHVQAGEDPVSTGRGAVRAVKSGRLRAPPGESNRPPGGYSGQAADFKSTGIGDRHPLPKKQLSCEIAP